MILLLPVSSSHHEHIAQRLNLKDIYLCFAGGSASAAGKLVEKLGGTLIGYLFILELDFLKGRDKLTAPVETLLRDEVMGT
jgi:hypothetical protein